MDVESDKPASDGRDADDPSLDARARPAGGSRKPVARAPRKGRMERNAARAPRTADLLQQAIDAHRGGDLDKAERLYRMVLRREPRDAIALNDFGILLVQRGRREPGEALIRKAVAEKPDYAVAHANLGMLLREKGEVDAAIAAFEQAVAAKPDYAEGHFNLALAFEKKGDSDAAVAAFDRAIESRPAYPEAHFHRANALRKKGDLDKAIAAYREATALKPDFGEAYANLGVALAAAGEPDEAAAAYRRALEIKPENPSAQVNLGHALVEKGDVDGAIAEYRQALALAPDWAHAHFGLSLALLQKGDHAEGWHEYEWRWKGAVEKIKPRDMPKPQWQGEDLSGKTLLLYAEQGLGDTLQFVRFVPSLAARGGRVVLEVPGKLLPLLRMAGVAENLVAAGAGLPEFDFHLPLLTLPSVIGLTEETIPAEMPYLAADPARVALWRERLPKGGFRVGIIWQGFPNANIDKGRSIPLRCFAPIAGVPGVRLISLQKNYGLDQLDALPEGMQVETLGPDFDAGPAAFLDTAAVMAELDLVITSDTSIAHLAGALGRPVWIMLKSNPDWRWLTGREDSPWYPTARLFRQRKRGDWDEVLGRVAAELALVTAGDTEKLFAPGQIPPVDDRADRARAAFDRGFALHRDGSLAAATADYCKAVALDPNHAEAYANLGVIRHGSGRIDEAITLYRRAVAIKPEHVSALGNLAVALTAKGDVDGAIAALRQVVAAKPDDPKAHFSLAHGLQTKGELDRAIEGYRQAIALDPSLAQAHANLGVALSDADRVEEGIAECRQSLALRPDNPRYHSNLGLALSKADDLDAALEHYRRAVEIDPDYAEGHANLALALLGMGQVAEAIPVCRRAVELDPDNAGYHFNLSNALLLNGDYTEGWQEYEWRLKTAQLMPMSFSQPVWVGEETGGRVILLVHEQGFGDTLQFCRYATLAAARGRVVLAAPRLLARLLGSLAGVERVVADGDTLPPFDLYCPFPSLPRAFNTTIETIPASVPYLAADAGQVASWKRRLEGLAGLRVGLVWAGNARPNLPGANAIDRRRSMALAHFGTLAHLAGVSFVSLQKGAPAVQARSPPPGLVLHDWTDELDDFADTAALIEALDLVISVDTSVVHLAGALGKPVWILSRFDGCWRWLSDRDDSPWYPTARLFRQRKPGDWDEVLQRVAAELAQVAAGARERLLPAGREEPGGSALDLARAAFDQGFRLHREGKLDDAAAAYRKAITIDPNHAEAYSNLGVIRHGHGRIDEAITLYRRAVAIKPAHLSALGNLAVALTAKGDVDGAIAALRQVVAAKPDDADGQLKLGDALRRKGDVDGAVDAYRQAVAAKPDDPKAHFSLAHGLQTKGELDRAIEGYRQAIALDPSLAQAHANLGVALSDADRVEDGIAECRQALALRPDNPQYHSNLGLALSKADDLDAALEHYRRAVEIDPDYVEGHANLALALVEKGDIDGAIDVYRQALVLNPNYADAHMSLGNLLRGQGKTESAMPHYERALALKPDDAKARVALCMTELPVLYRDEAEIAVRRAAYERRLRQLSDDFANRRAPADLADAVGSDQPFFLPYQSRNDRDLQSLYGALMCRVMAERYSPPPLPPPPRPGEPVRLGIVSGYFHRHSNWKIPLKGWISQIDRKRFRLFGYYTGSQRDDATETAAAACERFIQGPLAPERWRETILADAPHVLIYPEVGMHPVAAWLAAQRLAPTQCNAWGHPVTSGFPTLDYYLSSELMEPPDGQDHYTEKLIRLPNLSIYYEPVEVPPVLISRSELGLRSTATVYWCGQSLYKYLPKFDRVFPSIAREAGDCQFVFLNSQNGEYVLELFRKRLGSAFGEFGLRADDFCIFLPRLDLARFSALIGQCDIVLDSIGWSGCNSTLESLVHDLPIVTLKGSLMRGRHSAAIFEIMGVGDTVADTVDDYISTAIRLAQDVAWRKILRERISERKHRLYRDRACISALESFLDRQARAEASDDPLDLARAAFDQGFRLHREGKLDDAVAAYREAITLDPNHAEAHSNLGVIRHGSGRIDEAITLYRQAVAIKPDHVSALGNLAVALTAKGDVDGAIAALRQAVAAKPDDADGQLKLGDALRRKGDIDGAIDAYRQAVAAKPDDPKGHFSLAHGWQTKGDLVRAIGGYRQAIALDPGLAQAHANLGVALVDADRVEEGIAECRQALALRPDNPQYHFNLGLALSKADDLDAALGHYRRAVEIDPDYAEGHANLALALVEKGVVEEAIACDRRAILLKPDYAEAHFNLSLALLLNGEFGAGWQEYEWRYKGGVKGLEPGKSAKPLWQGEDLAGKTLLLSAEQGLGDTLQFARFAAVLAARGARIILAGPRELVTLLRSTPGVEAVVGAGEKLPRYDFHLPLMSVPAVLGTTETTIPANVPYLAADPERVALWRARLPADGFKVGVVWQGRPDAKIDKGRSVPLRAFAPIAAVPGVRLISLQKSHGLDQLDALLDGMRVATLGPDFDAGPDAFLDTAAVIESLDLVITSDTSAAHLSGALGRPVWVALKHLPDWRWQLDREDSPWYPTARLFRQRAPGDWGEVFERVATELARLVSGEREENAPANLEATPIDEPVLVPVAVGELADKITILEIKTERITDAAKLRNVRSELDQLRAVWDRRGLHPAAAEALIRELKKTNESLWAIEDEIRDCERQQDFGPPFVELARAVYRTNDRRAEIKREINLLAGSAIIEEKSYRVYQSAAIEHPDSADQAATPRGTKPALAAAASGGMIPGYVISLARRPDRRDRFLRWNSREGIDISVFDAVDGQTLSKDDLLRSNIIDDEQINFTMGFLGSAMSHRALWQRCVELGHPILIFEDDVFLPDSLKDWSEQVSRELANGCDILYLGYNRDALLLLGYGGGAWCDVTFKTPMAAFEDEAHQHNRWSKRNSHCLLDTRYAWGIPAYAISPRGAQSLLRHCFPLSEKHPAGIYPSGELMMPYSIDGMINAALARGLIKARAVFPPLVIGPNDPSESDNLTKPGDGDKMRARAGHRSERLRTESSIKS